MTISEPKPTRSAPEPDREPQRDDAPPFPTKFGHDRRRRQPPRDDADGARHPALDEDPFEDDGGL
jgi:hypothetical protein